MALSVQLGLFLAMATAVASLLGFLFKHRGAVQSPDVEWRHPLRSSLRLFRSPVYALGMAVAMASWGLHVAALSLAPISLVQTVIAGGLVLLTVLANGFFGHEVTRREWIGVGMTALGLAFLAATVGNTGDSAHAGYTPSTLVIYVGLLTAFGTAAAVIGWNTLGGASLVALSAGLLWGASDTSIKALSGDTDRGVAVLLHPLALVILSLSLFGLLVSTRSLQRGGAVAVIAVTSAAANVVTIAAGPIVFGEPMPSGGVGVVVRLLAFVLVVTAAALTPPPRAREEELAPA